MMQMVDEEFRILSEEEQQEAYEKAKMWLEKQDPETFLDDYPKFIVGKEMH